jgi:hypothetical protein
MNFLHNDVNSCKHPRLLLAEKGIKTLNRNSEEIEGK